MHGSARPEKHTKSVGAGGSIINILEGCKSDVSRFLTKEEQSESVSQTQYGHADAGDATEKTYCDEKWPRRTPRRRSWTVTSRH